MVVGRQEEPLPSAHHGELSQNDHDEPSSPRSGAGSLAFSECSADDDEMITVRAHNKKTGEITVMRVRKGTPMKEVMSKYAQTRGVKADRLSWKRRSTMRDSVVVAGTVPGPELAHKEANAECTDCGCAGYVNL